MAASDDFKQQLKAGKIVEALALALGEAVELKITTWASSKPVVDAEIFDPGQELPKPGHRLQTRINLLKGELENEIGSQFLGSSSYKELRQFHLDQVNQSHKIIQDNLSSLQKLFELWVKMQHSPPAAPTIEPELSGGSTPLPPAPTPIMEPSPAPAPEESPPSLLEHLNSLPVVAPPRLDALHLGTDENFHPSVLEHLNSLPVVRPPNLDALHLGTEEHWGNFTAEGSASVGTGASPTTTLQENPRQRGGEAEGNFLTAEGNEANLPSESALASPVAEEWDNWVEEEDATTGTMVRPQSNMDLQAEEEWDTWVDEEDESAAETLNLQMASDWDELLPEAMEAYPNLTDADKSANEPDASWIDDEDWETEPLSEISRIESLEHSSPTSEVTGSSNASSDRTPSSLTTSPPAETPASPTIQRKDGQLVHMPVEEVSSSQQPSTNAVSGGENLNPAPETQSSSSPAPNQFNNQDNQ
jgi:hypothetical protein